MNSDISQQLTNDLTSLFGIVEYLNKLLIKIGIPAGVARWMDQVLCMILLLLLVYLIDIILMATIGKGFRKLTGLTKNKWDDVLFDKKVFKQAIRIIPAIIFIIAVPIALKSPQLISLFKKIGEIYVIVQILRTINAAGKSLGHIFSISDTEGRKPIKAIFQVISVIAYFFGTIVIVAILVNAKPLTLITGLGASMAIITLIFKDTIVGFIAGLQLSSNDMLRVGDWITSSKYNADGEVEEITLYTVKVRGFDNTITTVPPYALIGDSFQNWRGMRERGARRVKRSINIDMKSIKFCTPEMLERFKKILFVKEYIEEKEAELKQFNETIDADYAVLVNGRRQTNIGIFRAYLQAYLNKCEEIKPEFTCMVRQLQPTEKGLPVELYFFTHPVWTQYENVQSDIFDHVLAIIPQFDLRVFQYPTEDAGKSISYKEE